MFWKYAAISGKHLCWSVISIELQGNFIEIALQHECSLVNLLYIFWTPFPKKAPGWLRLNIAITLFEKAWTWMQKSATFLLQHCVKSIQIRRIFWSVFSRIWTEYEKIRTRKNSVSGYFSRSAGNRTEHMYAKMSEQKIWETKKIKLLVAT